jgi:sugar (pentulose or hexulose) kinase
MVKSDLFNAIQADSYGKTVLRPMNDEATSLGAWISGAVHLGWYGTFRDAFNSATADNAPSRFDPDTHKAAIYAGLLRDRKRIYNSLSASGQAGPGA